MYEQRKRTKSQDHSWIEAWWRGRADVFRDQQRVRCEQRRGERGEERGKSCGKWLDMGRLDVYQSCLVKNSDVMGNGTDSIVG